MRKFFSYGPINSKLHYYVPRQELINEVMQQLLGDDPNEGGHYITIWAPRQTGKTWIMRQVLCRFQQESQFDVVLLHLQSICNTTDINRMAQRIAQELMETLGLKNLTIDTLDEFHLLFKQDNLNKPLILILDEFDTLPETVIAQLVSIFCDIYHHRGNQIDKPTAEKTYRLHSLALIGVRTTLGVENIKGSPFNIQRSIHIPNLTHLEVIDLFNQYQQDRSQLIEPEVVERIWYEFQGQPGLTCWFGELLTETHNKSTDQPITMGRFQVAYVTALKLSPNNNILNLISKIKQEAYKPFILELFQTKTKVDFLYDDPTINFLYLNGVISIEQVSLNKIYVKFACPYTKTPVQLLCPRTVSWKNS